MGNINKNSSLLWPIYCLGLLKSPKLSSLTGRHEEYGKSKVIWQQLWSLLVDPIYVPVSYSTTVQATSLECKTEESWVLLTRKKRPKHIPEIRKNADRFHLRWHLKCQKFKMSVIYALDVLYFCGGKGVNFECLCFSVCFWKC